MSFVGKLALTVILVSRLAFSQDQGAELNKGLDAEVQALADELQKIKPPDLSYDQLADKADLIVIAKVRSRSQIDWDERIAGGFDVESVNCFANKLRVLSTLKGRAADQIKVLTIEWKPNVVVTMQFDFAKLRPTLLVPNVFSLVDKGDIIGYGLGKETTRSINAEYLLYLQKMDGNGYVAVTGQRYSGKSVRLLSD